MTERERPEIEDLDDMLVYLDELRESGDTNMWGAAPWVATEFGLDRAEAKAVTIYWMDTFGSESR